MRVRLSIDGKKDRERLDKDESGCTGVRVKQSIINTLSYSGGLKFFCQARGETPSPTFLLGFGVDSYHWRLRASG